MWTSIGGTFMNSILLPHSWWSLPDENSILMLMLSVLFAWISIVAPCFTIPSSHLIEDRPEGFLQIKSSTNFLQEWHPLSTHRCCSLEECALPAAATTTTAARWSWIQNRTSCQLRQDERVELEALFENDSPVSRNSPRRKRRPWMTTRCRSKHPWWWPDRDLPWPPRRSLPYSNGWKGSVRRMSCPRFWPIAGLRQRLPCFNAIDSGISSSRVKGPGESCVKNSTR